MPKHGFSLTRIFPYKDKIYDVSNLQIYVLIRESTVKTKRVSWYILRSKLTCRTNETKYSKMDPVKFFKACLPQISTGPFLNTLSQK